MRDVAVFVLQFWVKCWSRLLAVFQRLTGRGCREFAWFMFVVATCIALFNDMRQFEPTAYFTNFINLFVYGVHIWVQLDYNKYVKNKEFNSNMELMSFDIVFNSWFTYNLFLIYAFSILLPFYLLNPFYFFETAIEIIWHIAILVYIDLPPKKTIWASAKEKVQQALEARTPNFAPIPA